MKTISVGELRQNPTRALGEVEHGESYSVTRHNQEIARLVPPCQPSSATPDQAMAVYDLAPLPDDSWERELEEDRTVVFEESATS